MRIFLAGATGVIGRRLVPLLVREGHQVTGMTRSSERAEELRSAGVDAAICDVFEADALEAVVTAAKPDVVIHELTDLPKRLEPRKYTTQLAGTNKIRREGTRNLVAAARAAGAKRVIAQSIAFAYAPSGDWVLDEEAPLALGEPAPMNDTVGAVADLERQVLDADGVVLRYGFFYGPGSAFAADGFYAELVRKRRFPILGSGEGRWSFIHVDDAASATVAALEHPSSAEVYNVVDDEPAPVRDWLPVFAASIDAKPPMRLPAWIGRLAGGSVAIAGMTSQRGASNAKARRELGWEPRYRSWREGFSAKS